MPHADKVSKTNGTKRNANGAVEDAMTNGDLSRSEFFCQLASYPVVHDGITTYKENPYGAKSLSLMTRAYTSLLQPVQSYFRGPYAYVAPYLAKADSLGVSGLNTLETRFPIVKEDTSTVKGKVHGVATIPLKVASQSKEYVFKTYDGEFQKTTGQGVVRQAKALISTELKLTSDIITWVVSFLRQKKDEGVQKAEKKLNN